MSKLMGSRGVCWDNPVAETLFAALKKKIVYRRSWPTRQGLIREIFEYVDAVCNRRRRHSTLGYLPPAEFRRLSPLDGMRQITHTTKAKHQQLRLPCKRLPVHRTGGLRCPSEIGGGLRLTSRAGGGTVVG
jgi:hypothetical protein